MSTSISSYTDYNGMLDQYKTSITDQISELEDRKTTMTERLDSKYATLQKQWAAYDITINRLNSASSMFVELANAQSAAANR
jgi:flagellar capping protein FliD